MRVLSENKNMICDNVTVNSAGHVCFAGVDTTELAQKYATPLYLLDESKIREKCRIYQSAMKASFGADALPLYAGKALCIKDIYRIMREEGMGIDVVSSGEIFTAVRGGFPMERAYFHGNNKTDADISYAVENGVGYFVCDNEEELLAIEREASARDITQKILIRVAPGIDPHTHKAISTGSVDSKFGAAIETGQAIALVAMALKQPHVSLEGIHCHIGSQIFETQPFIDAAAIMINFAVTVRDELDCTLREINLGGGMGVPYLPEHERIDYAKNIDEIARAMRNRCDECQFPMPRVRMEPGRSIVADAGMTLYTVGTLKSIPGFRNYVSIDGGMPDNPRYALYQSPYTVLMANRASDACDTVCTVAGRCCESGDLVQEGVALPKPQRGDLLAVLTTGAYNYAMASNYNRIPRPAMVMLNCGEDRLILRRETFEDLIRNEL